MARSASTEPTAGELEVLQVLWKLQPAELGVICEALRQQRPVATTTVATMLGIMHKKKLVKRFQGERAYLWSARVTRALAASRLLSKLVQRVFHGSVRSLVAHLIEEGELSSRDRAELGRLLSGQPDEKPARRTKP